jgi:hypothetical protein
MHTDNRRVRDNQADLEAGMISRTREKKAPREHAVLVRLSAREQHALVSLMEREALPGATVLRRLLMREERHGRQVR